MTLTEALVKAMEQAHDLHRSYERINSHLVVDSPTLNKLKADAQRAISELTYWLDMREGARR